MLLDNLPLFLHFYLLVFFSIFFAPLMLVFCLSPTPITSFFMAYLFITYLPFVTCSHHLLPHSLLAHHLFSFSSPPSLWPLCPSFAYLLITCLHHVFITFVCHLLIAFLCCLFIIYLYHMLVLYSLACHMLRYLLNMLFLAHYLLVACFLSHPFFLHGINPLLACVGSKVRNKEANYSSSHLPLK